MNLTDMISHGYAGSELAHGLYGGYRYEMNVRSPRGDIILTATPVEKMDENRSFYVETDGIVRAEFKNGSPATKFDRGIEFSMQP